jgi:uncharacterized RmlC-like cupin family protein
MTGLPVGVRRRPTAYETWLEREGVPLVGGYGVEDLRALPLGWWERLGCPAAYVHLEGGNGYVGALVAEVPPGRESRPIHHLYEEQILILEGRGLTQFWTDDKSKALTVEWKAGSLFSPPLNVWYQMYNGSGSEPVRFVAVNNAVMMVNIFRNADVLFNTPYHFTDRFDGRENYFDSTFRDSEEEDKAVNFIPDVYAVPLVSHEERGRGYSRLGINLSGNAMNGHIGAFEVGTYKKAHRHGGGAQVIILSGQGFSLMWPRDGEMVRVDWRPGSMLVPPEGWYHTHCNTGPEPARVLALRRGFRGLGPNWYPTVSTHLGGHQLEYEDEPPELRAMYEAELARRGVPLNMAPIQRA